MINSEGKTMCFVCNLPIQSHQVGLVWQGGNGVDDLLREQVDQDIIRGRLGRGHRRDSSAQITTIDTEDCVGLSTPPAHPGKRRRSSLAHLGDLIQSWGSRDRDRGDVTSQEDSELVIVSSDEGNISLFQQAFLANLWSETAQYLALLLVIIIGGGGR